MAHDAKPPHDRRAGQARESRDQVAEPWRVQVRLRRTGRPAGELTLQISAEGDQLLIGWEPVQGASSSQQVARAQVAAWLRAGGEREPLVTGDVVWLSDCELRVLLGGVLLDSLPVTGLPALLAVALR